MYWNVRMIYEYIRILYLNFFKKYDVIYFSTLTGSPLCSHLPALLSHSLSFCLIYIFSLYFILHVAQYFHYLQICCTCMFPNSTHTHTHTHTHPPPRLDNSSSFYFYLDSDLLYFISLSYYLFLHMLLHLFHHRK